MATGDVFRVQIAGLMDGEPFEMQIGLIETGGGAGPDAMVDVATAVNTALGGGTVAIAGLTHNMSIRSLIVSDVVPGTRPRKVIAIGPHVGGYGGNGIPGVCAGVISWQTELRGPANRGRIYVPGVSAADTTLGTIASAGITVLTNFANLLFTPFVTSAAAYQLAVLSFVPGSHPRVLREAVPVTGFIVPSNIKTQRRRGVGVRIGRRSSP